MNGLVERAKIGNLAVTKMYFQHGSAGRVYKEMYSLISLSLSYTYTFLHSGLFFPIKNEKWLYSSYKDLQNHFLILFIFKIHPCF